MSELPISSPYRSTPDAPVTDGERDGLTVRLNDAYAAGSLETEDYRQRLDQLYAARRLGELVSVVEGLAPRPTYAEPELVRVGTGAPGELSPAGSGRGVTVAAVAAVAGIIVVLAIIALVVLGLG